MKNKNLKPVKKVRDFRHRINDFEFREIACISPIFESFNWSLVQVFSRLIHLIF